jgi:DegV family protein with EDD domain
LSKVAVMTDSNSGITQQQAKTEGVYVLPMPFFVNGETYFEDINLTQEQFYEKLESDADISTSMPAVADIIDTWDRLLKEYDEIVHIPMSSGLSGSCEAAMVLAREYEGRVQVVNNQRISVTLKQSVLDAKRMAEQGRSALEIKNYLEETRFESSIYIMLDTLYYLKKGGRITPAAAALGTLLKLKPVLQIQGEKLDAFAKARTTKQGKSIMIEAIRNDLKERFHDPEGKDMWIHAAYTKNLEAAEEWKQELMAAFPGHEIVMDPLSLSVSCHIGPGALAVTCCKKLHNE